MLKLMLKKQFLELFSQTFRRNAMGKRSGKGYLILFTFLFLYLFGAMVFLFFNMADAICPVLCLNGLSWFYFALIALIATVVGVVGSIFSAYSSLYRAKDNEFLLSMPIPPRTILLSRVITIYLTAFLFEALVWIPSSIVYALNIEFSFISLSAQFFILLLLPLLTAVLSCFLGWLVALIFAHVKHSQLVTIVLSLGFLGLYFYLYSKLLTSFENILAGLSSLAPTIKSFLYPFYRLGLGAQGDLLSLLFFLLFAAFLSVITFSLLSAGFLKLNTTRKGAAKTTYTESRTKSASPDAALLRREFARLTSSATYMLNGGLGVVFLFVLPIAAFLKRDLISTLLSQFSALGNLTAFIPVILCAVVCSMSSMNTLTAPSVSLEGRTIWLVQSLPIPPFRVLRAKFLLHMIVVAPATLFCALSLSLILNLSLPALLLVCLNVFLFVSLCALFGLFANLLFPNLNWTNEIIPIKQGVSVLLAIFAPWGLLVLLGVLCYALRAILSPTLFLIPSALLFLLLSLLLLHWLKTRGQNIFATL